MGLQYPDERRLSELEPLRRNRFFYGKLLDVLHLSMEQQYGMSNRQLLNRLNFGAGVLCGLAVRKCIGPDGQAGVEIEPGVAIDGWGRTVARVAAANRPRPRTGARPMSNPAPATRRRHAIGRSVSATANALPTTRPPS